MIGSRFGGEGQSLESTSLFIVPIPVLAVGAGRKGPSDNWSNWCALADSQMVLENLIDKTESIMH
jgi:hypothetical protein